MRVNGVVYLIWEKNILLLVKFVPLQKVLDISFCSLCKVHTKGGVEGGGGRFPLIYISFSWVRIRLDTEIQLPRLPAGTLFWWGCDCCDCDCCAGWKKSQLIVFWLKTSLEFDNKSLHINERHKSIDKYKTQHNFSLVSAKWSWIKVKVKSSLYWLCLG